MTRNFFDRGKWLFPAMLLVALVQNFHDLSLLFSEENLSLFRYDGPIFFKLLKDILYLSILLVILYHAQRTGRSPLTFYSVVLIALIMFLVLLSVLENGLIAGMIGLRWIFPFILFLLMGNWSKRFDDAKAVPWILLGLAGCLAAQVYQLFYMPPVFGEIFPGVPARTPGFFVAPNSAAFFACASAACVMVFVPPKSKLRLRLLAVWLALMISTLAQSGTGMIAAVLLGFYLICGRHRFVFWGIAFLTLVLVLPNLDFLTMREDYVELSGGGRLDAFLNITRDSALSVARFGLYTNTANLNSANPEDQLAPDSLLASWVGNFGFFTSLATVLCALFIRDQMRSVNWGEAMPCVLVLGIFSMTTIVFEAFPMNIYLALGIWSARRLLHPIR